MCKAAGDWFNRQPPWETISFIAHLFLGQLKFIPAKLDIQGIAHNAIWGVQVCAHKAAHGGGQGQGVFSGNFIAEGIAPRVRPSPDRYSTPSLPNFRPTPSLLLQVPTSASAGSAAGSVCPGIG